MCLFENVFLALITVYSCEYFEFALKRRMGSNLNQSNVTRTSLLFGSFPRWVGILTRSKFEQFADSMRGFLDNLSPLATI